MKYWPIVKQTPRNVCSISSQLYQINLPLKWQFQLPLRLPIWFNQIFSPWKWSHNFMACTDLKILNQRPKSRQFSEENYLLQVNFKPNEENIKWRANVYMIIYSMQFIFVASQQAFIFKKCRSQCLWEEQPQSNHLVISIPWNLRGRAFLPASGRPYQPFPPFLNLPLSDSVGNWFLIGSFTRMIYTASGRQDLMTPITGL